MLARVWSGASVALARVPGRVSDTIVVLDAGARVTFLDPEGGVRRVVLEDHPQNAQAVRLQRWVCDAIVRCSSKFRRKVPEIHVLCERAEVIVDTFV